MELDSVRLKEDLGIRAKDIIATGLNLGSKKHVNCPAHSDRKPSMSWFNDGLLWRCHACGENIDIYNFYVKYNGLDFVDAMKEVAKMLGVEVDMENKIKKQPVRNFVKKKIVKPEIKMNELTVECIEYMEKRKIKKETLDAWKVKTRNWYEKDVYVFQYFNLKGELHFVSYRGIGKDGIKGGREVNTEAILWGMDKIDTSKPLVIVEGQPDALSVWQSGYKNVVSVPCGSENLDWIDVCWDWLQKIDDIIVYADNDEPGMKMAKEIKNRLRCKVIFHEKYKDANELMYREGHSAVVSLINKAINQKPDGLLDVAEMDFNSLTEHLEETIETGFYEYDSHIEDWKMQELTLVFGRNGEGKTTFLSQIIAHCLEKGVKTSLFSGEMSDYKIQDWLYRQLIGDKKECYRKVETKYRMKLEPKPEIIKQIKEWHKGKLFLIDRKAEDVLKDLDKFFGVLEISVRRFGVKFIVIDNLMALMEENADSLNSDQANLIQRCKNFAIKNNIHIVLLAHPNKSKQEVNGSEENGKKQENKGNLEKTDISGTNNIPNKADNIIAVERLWSDDRPCDAIITSLKDRESGQRKTMNFNFSKNTLRFYNQSTKETVKYGWEDGKVDESEEMKWVDDLTDDVPF